MSRSSMFGVLCTRSLTVEEDDLIMCDECGEPCCEDCALECEDCSNMVCRNCKSVFDDQVCMSCEIPYINKVIDKMEAKSKDDVFIIVGGMTYPIRKTGVDALILAQTDPFATDKIKFLDIKGLGMLKYSHRSVRGKGKAQGFEYFLYFNQHHDALELPWTEL